MVVSALAIVIFIHPTQSNSVEPAIIESDPQAKKLQPEKQVPPEDIDQIAGQNKPEPPRSDNFPLKPIPKFALEQSIAVVDLPDWRGIPDPAELEHNAPPQAFFVDLANRITNSSPIASPAVPSHYLAVNLAGMEAEYEIWNHYEARLHSALRISCGIADSTAVHSNGEYFAVQRSPSNNIEVFSVVEKKSLYTLPSPCGGARSSFIEFVRGSLVVFDQREGVLRFFDALTSHHERNVRIRANRPNCFALSPRHRYLAYADLRQANICLINLTEDSPPAIKLPIPKDALHGALLTCQLRFSPKGDQIAALVKSHVSGRMLCWNLSNGRLEHQHPLPTGPGLRHPDEDNSFQWLPDADGWLLAGGDYVHKHRGGPAASLKHFLAKHQTPVHVTPDGRLLVISRLGNQRTLESFPWPKERVAQAVERFAAGELPHDIKFPPLTAIDDSTALHPSAPAGPLAWQVKPSSAEPDPSANLSKSIVLASSRQDLTALLVSEQAARAVLFFNPKESSDERTGQSRRIETYDLKTQKLYADFDVAFPGRAMAANADGSRVLLRSDEGDRLDVLSSINGKHLVGFRPYANDIHNPGSAITAAHFVGADHVLTMNTGGVIRLWKIPQCQAVYEFRTNFSGSPQAAPVLSPDGKYLAVAVNHSVLLLEAMTGKCCGRLATRGLPPISVLAFHPQGSRLAAGFHAGEISRVKVWRLDSGEEAAEVELHENPSDLVWCGPNHLLCNNRFLADLTKQVLVWKYVAPAGRVFPNNNFGLCWYVTSTALHDPATLVAISLPDQEVTQRLDQTKIPAPLFPADAPICLAVKAEDFPEPIRETLPARVMSRLTGSRHKLRPDAPYQLKINARETQTDRFMQISGLLFGLSGVAPRQIPIDEITVLLELSDNRGTTIWKDKRIFETGPLEIRFPLPEGGNPAKPLKEQLWNRATEWINSASMPSAVHPSNVREGYGESYLTPEGPQLHRHNPMSSATQTKLPVPGDTKPL